MSEIFQLVGVVVTIYFLSVRILMLYRRCSEEEAKETIASCLPKIASWFQENATGSRPTNKGNDSILDCGLIDEIWASIRLVLGESRYNQLLQLAKTGTQLFSEGYHSGLHCIWLSLFHTNDSEKQRLATILIGKNKIKITEHFPTDGKQLDELITDLITRKIKEKAAEIS